MKFFKSREALSRRSMRLWMLRFRTLGILFCVIGVATAAGVYGWKNGVAGKARDWVAAKTLSVTASAGFRVSEIIVSGRHRIEDAELLTRLGIKQGMPIFGIDIIAEQQSLSEISWVKDVSITRRLPGTIIVELTERQPAALWQYQKKISVIDSTGRALTAKHLESYKTLPLVVGEDAPLHIAGLLALLKAEPGIAAELASAVRIGGRRWDLRLRNGLLVKLPENDSEFALRRLASQQEKNKLFDKNVVTIDLRIPDQMVVEPGAASAQEQTKKTI